VARGRLVHAGVVWNTGQGMDARHLASALNAQGH